MQLLDEISSLNKTIVELRDAVSSQRDELSYKAKKKAKKNFGRRLKRKLYHKK